MVFLLSQFQDKYLNHLFHPVKYLVFVAQKRKFYDRNQLNNYTNWEEFHYTTFNDNSQNPIYDISQSNDLFRQMYFILYLPFGVIRSPSFLLLPIPLLPTAHFTLY